MYQAEMIRLFEELRGGVTVARQKEMRNQAAYHLVLAQMRSSTSEWARKILENVRPLFLYESYNIL